MERKEDDRRVRKTKARLREALVELLREKRVEEITVTGLTRRADVNRGTFYCHYRDVHQMVEQLEEELFEEFEGLLDAYPASQLRCGLRPILQDMFDFVIRNADIIISTLGSAGEKAFLSKLTVLVQERVVREWSALYHFESEARRDYCLAFIVGGVVSLIERWAAGRGTESAGEMAALAEEMILRGIEPLGRR